MEKAKTHKTNHSVLTRVRELMFCFGLIMGAVFPFFSMLLLDVPAESVLTPKYFVGCILAGLLVGGVSSLLMELTVVKEILKFKNHVSYVSANIREYKEGSRSLEECANCYLEISSADALGEIQEGMNALTATIRSSFYKHELTDSYYQLLNYALDTQQLCDNTLRYFAENLSKVVACELFIFGETGLQLKGSLFVYREIPPAYYKFLQDVVKLQRVHVSDESTVLADTGHLTEMTKGHLVFPILDKREQLGALVLYVNDAMGGDDIRHVNRLLKQFQLAYGNARAYSQIKGLATYDGLTKVYNRQHGMQLANEEFEACRREHIPISVIMLDLDHFKQLNDSFGHPAGDMILQNVAALLDENTRGRDLVIRYGGEEFVVVMPQTGRRDAAMRIQAILQNLNGMKFSWNKLPIQISFSAGVASSEGPIIADYSLESVLHQADGALYKAKQQGRNQVVTSS